MSVLVSHRKESKLEVIIHAEEIHDMLWDLASRDFGIKDPYNFVRKRYDSAKVKDKDYETYLYLLIDHKQHINELTKMLLMYLRAANSLYPTTLHEYEVRRDNQNYAIVTCEQLIAELQMIVEEFEIDINPYGLYISAIDREIVLIKKWRQRDNKLKSSIVG